MSSGEPDHSNTEVTVEGELDAAWSSDLKDRDVKSPSSPEDVEYATAPEEQQGDAAFEFLPEGVERDDLTDLQAEIIETAVFHDPESYTALADEADCSMQTVRVTLRQYAPDLAERVKMDTVESCRVAAQSKGSDDSDSSIDDEDDEDPEPEPITADGYGDATADHPAPRMQPRRVERAIEAAETIETVSTEVEARKAARHIRNILEGGDDD